MLFVHTATSAHVAAIHRQILADDIVPANLFSTLQRCHIERYRGCLNDGAERVTCLLLQYTVKLKPS